MNELIDSPSNSLTLADLWDRLGQIPLERILLSPPLGTATEDDLLLRLDGENKRVCELVDGTLVEKPMGLYESVVATWIIRLMTPYFNQHDPGILSGADGPFRLTKGLVRLPDVCFVSWAKIPDRRNWIKAISDLVPDLVIEVLSPGNTRKEMDRKLRDYFDAGVRMVWYIDPRERSAMSYKGLDQAALHDENMPLDGADVLPGFALSLKELFDLAGNPRGDE